MKQSAWIALGLMAFLISVFASANESFGKVDDGEPCNADQPSDYYFVPKERFANQLFLIKMQRPGQVVDDRYSSNIARFVLRPINTNVAFPRNYLQSIQRPCARIAHQYWDLVFLEALWPGFSPRTLKNEALFAEGASLDRIVVRVGFLSEERVYRKLQNEIMEGKLVETARNPSLGLKEYRDPQRKEAVFPSFYIADIGHLLTPNGNPLVISCSRDWMGKIEDAVGCEVTFTLPYTLWKKEQQHLFGGVQGLEITYWFYKKHLASWDLIHRKILRMVDDSLTDIDISSSNKSLNLDKTRSTVLSAPSIKIDAKLYHTALLMVKKLHLGDNLESMSYRVATTSQTYLMVTKRAGESTAQSLFKDELKRLQPKYQNQWDENLARSYMEFFDSNELQSITDDGESSKYFSRYTLKQNDIGKIMQSKSTGLLNAFVSEATVNVFTKVAGKK